MRALKLFVVASVALLAMPALAAEASPSLYAGMQWRELGPFRAGWATVVAGVPDKPDTYYFGGAGGGVWRTDNAGHTWAPVFEHGPAAAIGALAVAPSNPNVIYAGTGQATPRYDIGAGLGVFKSVDGGAHWQSLGLRDTRYIGRIWIDPKNADVVLVAAEGHFFGPSPDRGVYRSTDGGKHWSHVLKIDDRTGAVDITADPGNPQILFAAAWEAPQYPWLSYFKPVAGPGSAIYKSTDGGLTWKRLSGGGWPEGALGRISVAAAHVGKSTRVYATVDAGKQSGLYRSDDGGTHWVRVNPEDAFTDWYFSRVTVAPDDPNVVYLVGQSMRRCTDGGRQCTIVKGSPGGDDYHFIWINPKHPDHLITGSDQGATVSVDGGKSWSSWYNQPTAQFYHIAADNRFPYWIYGGQQDSGTVGIASRSDYGQITFRDWHPVGGDERDYDIPDPSDPMIVYGSGLGGHVSKWDGRTGQVADVTPWPEDDYGKRPTLTKYRYMWMTPLVGSATGKPALYLGAQVLFRTEDQAKTWQVISGDLTGKVAGAKNCNGDVTLAEAKDCGYGVISAIAPSPRHDDEIWVGTDDGLIQLTRDGGAHWQNVTPPDIPLWGKVRSIDVSALQDGVAYVAIDTHRIDVFQPMLLKTRDYGKTWQRIDAGLPPDHLTSVLRADPVKQGLLYAGTDAGVFASFDDGDHWQSLQQNLPTAWITDLLVHDGDLIAASEGRGIWVLDDVAPLREMGADIAAKPAYLFTPAKAFRVNPDNNKDTPLPPETPVGQNPPAGAIIDYWLDGKTAGPVTLEIRDDAGHVVRRFASNATAKPPKAERYFAKGWVRPAEALSAAPGMHRFVWNLRYARPEAIGYDYSIAAVWGKNTPVNPSGAFVLPGDYTVVLTADGRSYSAPLHVAEDPRVKTNADDLNASLLLSQNIYRMLARARRGYGEIEAVRRELDARFPATAKNVSADAVRATLGTGAKFQAASTALSHVETALESADVAPSAAQNAVVARALAVLDKADADWTAAKSGALAALNAALEKAHEKPITIPPPDKLDVEAPDPGQDLP